MTAAGDPLTDVVYSILYSGTVTVRKAAKSTPDKRFW